MVIREITGELTDSKWCRQRGLEPEIEQCQLGYKPHPNHRCCEKCQKICPPSFEFQEKGSCQCQKCKPGTFSNIETGTAKCIQAQNCELENKLVKKKGSRKRNAICGVCKPGYQYYLGNPKYACEKEAASMMSEPVRNKAEKEQRITTSSEVTSLQTTEPITSFRTINHAPTVNRLAQKMPEDAKSIDGTEIALIVTCSCLFVFVILVIYLIALMKGKFYNHQETQDRTPENSSSGSSRGESLRLTSPDNTSFRMDYTDGQPGNNVTAQPTPQYLDPPRQDLSGTDLSPLQSYSAGYEMIADQSGAVLSGEMVGPRPHTSISQRSPDAFPVQSNSTQASLSLNLTVNGYKSTSSTSSTELKQPITNNATNLQYNFGELNGVSTQPKEVFCSDGDSGLANSDVDNTIPKEIISPKSSIV